MGDLRVRVAGPGDGAGIARVKIDTWRFAYKHIVDHALLSELDLKKETGRWEERLGKMGIGERCWIVSLEDTIAGFLYVGPNRFPEFDCDAELQAIYVLPSMHRQGLGRLMLRPAVDWLIEEGFECLVVVVFRDNPLGTGFYKGLGAQLLDDGELEIGGKKYPDQSYIWPSLAALQNLLEGRSQP